MSALSSFEARLGDLGAYAVRHRARVLWRAAVVTLLALPAAWQAAIAPDRIPPQSLFGNPPREEISREIEADFGETFSVIVSTSGKSSPEQIQNLKSFGQLLRVELEKVGTLSEDRQTLNMCDEAFDPKHVLLKMVNMLGREKPWLRQVECRTGQGREQALKKIVQNYPFALLSPEDIETAKTLFDPKKLDERMIEIAALKADLPPNSAEVEKLRQDPLNILELAQTALHGRLPVRAGSSDDDGYFISPDKTTLTVKARSALPGYFRDFSNALVIASQRAVDRASTTFRAKNHLPENLQMRFVGPAAIAAQNNECVFSNVFIVLAVALACLFFLSFIILRGAMPAACIVLASTLVALWSLAVAGMYGFSGTLLGASVVIPVIFSARYALLIVDACHCNPAREMSPEESMRRTFMRAGLAILCASTLAVICFFGAAFAPVTALQMFGIAAGINVLLACVGATVVYPAMLGATGSFGLRTSSVLRRYAINIAGGAVLCGIVIGVWSTHVTHENSQDSEMRILIDAPDEAAAFAGQEEVIARVKPFVDAGELVPNGSVQDYIHSPRQQQATLDALKTFDLNAAASEFRKAAAAHFGDKNAVLFFKPFLKTLNEIKGRAANPEILTLSVAMQSSLASTLSNYVRLAPSTAYMPQDRERLVSSWLPAASVASSWEWNSRVAAAVEKDFTHGIKMRVSTPALLNHESYDRAQKASLWTSALAALGAAVLMSIIFRSFLHALWVAISIFIACLVWLAGVWVLRKFVCDFSFDFVNLSMFPILFGVVLDSSILMAWDAKPVEREAV